MKIKLLLLVGIGFAPLSLMAQASFLYNKGLMSVKSTGVTGDNPKTTLYINGDFIAGRDATTTSVRSQIHLEGSQTVLTGNFIHEVNGAIGETGAVSYHNSNVFVLPYPYTDTNASRFVFRGTSTQYIKTDQAYSPTLKGNNYITFPNLVIENTKHVVLVPELAASAQNVDLNGGRFIIDSRRIKASDVSGITTMHTVDNSSMLAHFMVEAPITGNTAVGQIRTKNSLIPNTTTDNNLYGAIQVNLSVDDPAIATANERQGRSLIAFGSPYKEMRADYFFWNFLMIPTGESIIGQTAPGNTMTDPTYKLQAGKAFVVGVDLRGTNAANYEYDIHPTYYKDKGILFAERNGAGVSDDNVVDATNPSLNREKGKYFFSRFGPMFKRSVNIFPSSGLAANVPNKMPKVAVSTSDAYTGEVLNNGDISLPLVVGYNYFSNPFTVPLNVEEMVNSKSDNNTLPAWNNLIVGNAQNASRNIANRVWVLDPTSKGSGTYDVGYTGVEPGNKWVSVSAKYRVIRPNASTAFDPPTSTVGDYDEGTGRPGYEVTIAPLQMFVLYAAKADKNIIIPASKRAIYSNALFLRSAPAEEKTSKDDFLFHITDEEVKASDRVAIAIRTPQDIMTNAEYAPTKKMIALISTSETKTTSETVEGVVKQSGMSTMYTRSEQGDALESNILGVPQSAQTESVVLYVTPSAIPQNVTLKASRLGSAERVQGITLIDKVANKEFDLFGGKSYTTSSKATDPIDRFTVRFTFNTSGIEDGDNNSESKNITSYYFNGVLTVSGFEDSDFGSVISVYDIQGRKVAQAKVDDTSVEIRQAFFTGAYIVKVVGKKSYAAKFLVK
ncbi:T9SS type A sorting domain-containing protein [Dysgonomonas sp. HGC4]|uniref:T9SS type A sorting domain-containing protein n=1 Tax=Dysgonomonas sp. HGC4 TaxID=1658009 RepID=UPI000682E113|nr:T9SS type A sorting domain-containing protein [Dysgonomonas sp. HGC4]MBD8346762.1 T9SS type A sorting domain-containing protein [Dysgonomonas sp. HGC4]